MVSAAGRAERLAASGRRSAADEYEVGLLLGRLGAARPAYDSISLQNGASGGHGYEDSLSLRSLDAHLQASGQMVIILPLVASRF